MKSLVAQDNEVIVLDDMSRGSAHKLEGVNCTIFNGDIRDPAAVKWAMQGVQSVVHLAYLQGTQNFYDRPKQMLDVALRGVINVLYACENRGVGELLLVSSSEVYQTASVIPTPEDVPLVVPDVLNPRYSYGGGKIACELAAIAWAQAGILSRLLIARPHNIYGEDCGIDHVIPQFCQRMNHLVREYPTGVIPFPIQGSGHETRSFCYVDDFVRQMQLILEPRKERIEIFNIGTEDERTVSDVAHAVAACYDREIKLVPGVLQRGSPLRRCPDTAKIQTLDDVESMDFAEGVRRTVDWYRKG